MLLIIGEPPPIFYLFSFTFHIRQFVNVFFISSLLFFFYFPIFLSLHLQHFSSLSIYRQYCFFPLVFVRMAIIVYLHFRRFTQPFVSYLHQFVDVLPFLSFLYIVSARPFSFSPLHLLPPPHTPPLSLSRAGRNNHRFVSIRQPLPCSPPPLLSSSSCSSSASRLVSAMQSVFCWLGECSHTLQDPRRALRSASPSPSTFSLSLQCEGCALPARCLVCGVFAVS